MSRAEQCDLLADGHVHLHDAFSIPDLLEAALERSRANTLPVLLFLAEVTASQRFRKLATERPGGLRETGEARSLEVQRDDGWVFVLAGRQKISSESLEVLALGLDPEHALNQLPDGSVPAVTLIEYVIAAGAVAVLPWGFGKWLGARGRLVADLAGRPGLRQEPRFFLGDVPQRCAPWPRPRVFRHGIRVLPGTDPLPLPGAEAGVARYGFRMAGPFDPERPAAAALAILASGAPVTPVGKRDGFLTTLAAQIRYRLRR